MFSAEASCTRISNASTPAIKNHKNDVIPYRVPIRLWSTVPIQPQMPVSDWGRGKNLGNVSAFVVTIQLR